MAERRADDGGMESRALESRLSPALDEAELAQVWRGVRDAQADARRAPRRRRLALMAVGGSAALAAAAAALVLWLGGSPARPARVAGPVHSAATALDPGVRVSAAGERALPMNDGSVVTLAPAAELEVLANEGDKFVTAVRRGRAHFDVHPDGPRRWVIETDLATVEVVGTAFSVERSTTQLHVAVDHGVVLVRGERVPGRIVRLTAGETLAIPSPPPLTATDSSTDTATATDAGVITSGGARAGSSTSLPGIKPRPTRPAAEDVIDEADRLLAAGKPAQAAAILDAYLDDAPSSSSAGLAAFLLGRIAQDTLHDSERAAAALAFALSVGSPRAIQPEALARRARALADADRPDEAIILARDYLQRYPSGAAAPAMRRLAEHSTTAP